MTGNRPTSRRLCSARATIWTLTFTTVRIYRQDNMVRNSDRREAESPHGVRTGCCLEERHRRQATEAALRTFTERMSLLEEANKARTARAQPSPFLVLPEEANKAPTARAQSSPFEVTSADFTKPFCDFLTANPTVFHAVDAVKRELEDHGYTRLSERDAWTIKPGGKYIVERNGSALLALVVGDKYEPGNGAAIVAGHVDALTAKLKPISEVPNQAGYLQLGVAP